MPRLTPPVSPAQICQIVSEVDTKIDLNKLKTGVPLIKSGGDSLDFFNVILAIEDACGIIIPSEDTPRVNSLDRIVDYLNERLS